MLILATTAGADEHVVSPHHPERRSRLPAALSGLAAAGLGEALHRVEVRAATDIELRRAHSAEHVESVARLCNAGGGWIDADTQASAGSWRTALLAAGAGLVVVETLDADDAANDGHGEFVGGLVVARPPGHHASRTQSMGFCLANNIAVTAAALAARGERVLIVDWDVHHGNGTQAIFWDDPRVLFVSTHLAGHYPYTGFVEETGGSDAPGTTINVPLPRGATGDVLMRVVEEIVAPASAAHGTTWVLVSAGFDSHREDPLGGLGLTAGDFAMLAERVDRLAPRPGRTILFLEGGYDLDALGRSFGAAAGALLGVQTRSELPTSGGPGGEVLRAVHEANARATTLG
jgi:acetoin utilization deacetylase AcuC-like enzyme